MFDKMINRLGTNCAKWDEMYDKFPNVQDLIPLTVADMDFKSSPEVVSALVDYANMGIYGYTNVSTKYLKLTQEWFKDKYNVDIDQEWITFCPRIIQSISLIIQNYTKENDCVMISTPLYSPITNAIEVNNRKVIRNKLLYKDGNYDIDFEDLEDKFKNGVKMYIIVSPHNPTGRIWSEKEILKTVELCHKYDVLLYADEVHADFVWNDNFTSFGKYFDRHDKLVVGNSPSKTFNIPGIEISSISIKDTQLRSDFRNILDKAGIHNPNYFTMPAVEAAYGKSDEWLFQLKEKIRLNKAYVRNFFDNELDGFKCTKSEATFLMWIKYDLDKYSEAELNHILINEAHVAVSMGSDFGEEGVGFFRLNVASPKELIEEALNRIKICLEKER